MEIHTLKTFLGWGGSLGPVHSALHMAEAGSALPRKSRDAMACCSGSRITGTLDPHTQALDAAGSWDTYLTPTPTLPPLGLGPLFVRQGIASFIIGLLTSPWLTWASPSRGLP